MLLCSARALFRNAAAFAGIRPIVASCFPKSMTSPSTGMLNSRHFSSVMAPICISKNNIFNGCNFFSTAVSEVVTPTQPDKFAVFLLKGKQYKVVEDDLIITERQNTWEIGSDLSVDSVLLIGTQKDTVVGTPMVKGALVTMTVEEHTKGPKVIIFKKKKRKNYRRWNGHRQEETKSKKRKNRKRERTLFEISRKKLMLPYTAIALFGFQGESEEELTFQVGDTIQVTADGPEGWLFGERQDGLRGYFPSNYVEEKNVDGDGKEDKEEEVREKREKEDDEKPNNEEAPVEKTTMELVEEILASGDHFETLGVEAPVKDLLGRPTWNLSDHDLRKAFRKKAMCCHPDKASVDEAESQQQAKAFAKLQEAWECLRHAGSKGEYVREYCYKKEMEKTQSWQPDVRIQQLQQENLADAAKRKEAIDMRVNEASMLSQGIKEEMLRKRKMAEYKTMRDRKFTVSTSVSDSDSDSDSDDSNSGKKERTAVSKQKGSTNMKSRIRKFGRPL